jgi:hypothetical protein
VKRDKKKYERKKAAGLPVTKKEVKPKTEKTVYLPPAMAKNPTPAARALLKKADKVKGPLAKKSEKLLRKTKKEQTLKEKKKGKKKNQSIRGKTGAKSPAKKGPKSPAK